MAVMSVIYLNVNFMPLHQLKLLTPVSGLRNSSQNIYELISPIGKTKYRFRLYVFGYKVYHSLCSRHPKGVFKGNIGICLV